MITKILLTSSISNLDNISDLRSKNIFIKYRPILTVITRNMYRCAYQLKPTCHIYSTLIHTMHNTRPSVIQAYNRDPKDLQSNPLNVADKNGFPPVEGVHRICSSKDCLSRVCLRC
jgi:hypothetical protein